MQHKETDTLGSCSTEQGSSWAVEIGGHLQVCSIMVENLEKQGLMLIEVCILFSWWFFMYFEAKLSEQGLANPAFIILNFAGVTNS